MLEIYHWEPNGSSLMALIVLHEKGRPFESRYLDWTRLEQLDAPPRQALEVRENLEIEGPVLVDDGEQICEAFFMMEYLDERFPAPPLKPRTPQGAWRVQVWGRFLGERIAPAVATLGVHRYFAPAMRDRAEQLASALGRMTKPERREAWRAALTDGFSDDILAESRRRAALLAERIEAALEGERSWLVDDAYSLADIAAFSFAMSLPKLAPQLCEGERSRAMRRWLERMHARPAVRSALALSRTGRPDEAFAPGPEHARWG
jgi:GSH-dependent disulfide-bond oxidoreductase